ncbi:hypothetical protein F5879DRAFT_981067 [Lentinula edodes]|nr:hypothetical protein F5879DRAFT_981067 [Lentinula edodes]
MPESHSSIALLAELGNEAVPNSSSSCTIDMLPFSFSNISLTLVLLVATMIVRCMFPCTSLDALERNLKVLEKKFHLCLLEGTLNYEDSVKFEIIWIGLIDAFSKIQVESYEARLSSPIQRVFSMKKRLFDIVGCNADVEQLQVSILYASEKTKQLQYKLEIDRVRVVSSASAALGMHTRSNHSLFKRSLYELRQVLKSYEY